MQLIDHLGIRDGHRNLTFLGGDWGFLGGASVLKDRPGGESDMYAHRHVSHLSHLVLIMLIMGWVDLNLRCSTILFEQ